MAPPGGDGMVSHLAWEPKRSAWGVCQKNADTFRNLEKAHVVLLVLAMASNMTSRDPKLESSWLQDASTWSQMALRPPTWSKMAQQDPQMPQDTAPEHSKNMKIQWF